MTPQELVKGTLRLVSLPEVVLRINQELHNEQCATEQIALLIQQDPALAARLLRIVNSAFFGTPRQIDTISRAIALVGAEELSSLIFASSIANSFTGIPDDLADMSDFWTRSVYTAVIARQLAEECDVLHTERLFITGLLHDIGSLVIYLRMPDQAREILSVAGGDAGVVRGLQREMLGFNFADVGAALAEAWRFPEPLCEAIAHQMDPDQAGKHCLDASIVYAAVHIKEVCLAGLAPEDAFADAPQAVQQHIRMDPGELDEFLSRLAEQFRAAIDLVVPGSRYRH